MGLGAAYPQLDWKETSWPGVRLAFLAGDRARGDANVLIEMGPGVGYPPHEHLGPEEVFVVAGSYRDKAGEYPTGSFQRHEAGTRHHPIAGPEGALLLARIEGGIEVLAEPR